MTLKLRLFKLAIAVVLGNADAIVSHQLSKTVPVWFIDLYAIPIEYLMVNSILIGLTKLYKRFKRCLAKYARAISA